MSLYDMSLGMKRSFFTVEDEKQQSKIVKSQMRCPPPHTKKKKSKLLEFLPLFFPGPWAAIFPEEEKDAIPSDSSIQIRSFEHV